jgi:hypothetical protein
VNGGNSVALMLGHGDVVVGPDIPTVVALAIYTEVDAKALIQATILGGPIALLDPFVEFDDADGADLEAEIAQQAADVVLDGLPRTFRWPTSRWRACRIAGAEFVRRFLQHVLPKGFHKVCYFGLWHPAKRRIAAKAQRDSLRHLRAEALQTWATASAAA